MLFGGREAIFASCLPLLLGVHAAASSYTTVFTSVTGSPILTEEMWYLKSGEDAKTLATLTGDLQNLCK